MLDDELASSLVINLGDVAAVKSPGLPAGIAAVDGGQLDFRHR